MKPKLTEFQRFAKITLAKYERYLPTAFDESLTLLEKMNKLIEYLNQMGVIVNDVVDQWNEVMEWIVDDGINDIVLNRLDEMVDDGTLATIINEHIFEELNDKVDKKADKDYVEGIDDRLENVENKISSLSVSLKDFGAIGDGVTDDSSALIDALSSLSDGGTLFVPEGTYRIQQLVDLPSNITIKGEGDNSRFTRNGRGMFARATATYGSPVDVSQNSLMGDHFITVDDTSGFELGDHIKIVSQTVAQSIEDAHPDFYLGAPTSSNDAIYFGEFRQISDINETTGQLFFRGGLMFPGYRTHNAQETHPKALRNAIVQKVNFIENIQIKDIAFHGDFSVVFRLDGVYNARLENVNWYDAIEGDFIAFRNSLFSEARHCGLFYTPDHTPSAYYRRNGLKSVSSTGCGFDGVKVSHGGQCVDFSYSDTFENTGVYPIPDIAGYLKNSTIMYATESTATAHQGTIDTHFINNTMLYARHQGIFTRARNGVVDGNTIVTGIDEEYDGYSPGIIVTNDASVNTRISNNTVDGFTIGLQTGDNANSMIGEMNLVVTGNNFVNLNTGIRLTRRSGRDFTGDSNIYIRGNTFDKFRQESGKLIDIGERYFNIFIEDNIFNCNSSLNGGIYTRGNAGRIYVLRNKFTGNLPNNILWFGDMTYDLPSYRNTYLFKDNHVPNVRLTENRFHTANLTTTFTDVYYQNLNPFNDGELEIGTASQRWDRVITRRGVVESSDRTLKENIENIKHGLDFINQLKPSEYTFKDGGKKRFGLIAQDVEQALDKPEDYDIVEKDGIYSLDTSQLIPIIIRAIQELQDKR